MVLFLDAESLFREGLRGVKGSRTVAEISHFRCRTTAEDETIAINLGVGFGETYTGQLTLLEQHSCFMFALAPAFRVACSVVTVVRTEAICMSRRKFNRPRGIAPRRHVH